MSSTSIPEQICDSLAELLADNAVTVDRVEITGAASVGATRSTLFVNIHAGASVTPVVAQLAPPRDRDDLLGPVDEANVLRLARAAGAPVPPVFAAAQEAPVTGDATAVVGFIPGESIPRRIIRATEDLGTGDDLAADLGTALAHLHSIPIDDLPDAIGRVSPSDIHTDYADDQARALDELGEPLPAVRLGIHWLRANLPSAPTRTAIVHGDLRNGNILVERGRLASLLDWEICHAGDPMEDLAWLCMRTWRFGNDDREVGGFGSLGALRTAYESAGGVWREDAFRWWLVARAVWWATGLSRQADAFLNGDADSIVLAASGRRVVELEYDLLRLIG